MSAVTEYASVAKEAAEKLAKKKANTLATYREILLREMLNKSLPKDSGELATAMRELNLSADDLQADLRALQEDAKLAGLFISQEERENTNANLSALSKAVQEIEEQMRLHLPRKHAVTLCELNTKSKMWEHRQNEANKAPNTRKQLHAAHPRVFTE